MKDFVEVFIFTQNKDAIFSEHRLQLAIGFAVLIFGLYWFWKAKREKGEVIQFFIAGFLLIWAVFWISTYGISFYSQSKKYSQITSIYNNRSYSVAEGNVKVLQPPSRYYKGDLIQVDGIEFEIHDSTDSFGYGKIIRKGGVLKDDVIVRLTYYKDVSRYKTENMIIRVEVLNTE